MCKGVFEENRLKCDGGLNKTCQEVFWGFCFGFVF